MKDTYLKYKSFLELNEHKYRLADKIVTEGIVDSLGLSVGLMDKVYARAAMFYMEYELVRSLVKQMTPLYE